MPPSHLGRKLVPQSVRGRLVGGRDLQRETNRLGVRELLRWSQSMSNPFARLATKLADHMVTAPRGGQQLVSSAVGAELFVHIV